MLNRVPSHSIAFRSSRCFGLMLVLACLGVVFLAYRSVSAQTPNIRHTDNTPDLSLRSDLTVDPTTLGMSFSLPLGNYPGRGLSLPITVTYGSKQWQMVNNGGDPGSTFAKTWNHPTWGRDSVAGWTSAMSIPKRDYLGGQGYGDGGHAICLLCCVTCMEPPTGTRFVNRMTITMPDGSKHELRGSDDVSLVAPTWSGV